MSSDLSQPVYAPTMKSDDPITQVEYDHILSPTRKSWWHQLKSRSKQIWSDTWFLEITALIVSSTCAVGIYATLGSLDGKPLPSMPKSLTINTIVAFLGTVAKSSLVLMISSCIGQLKWKWYQRNRSLQDTQLFDDASRGPLGALQMLVENRGRSAACLGALILILALLFDPFVQQTVTYPNFSDLQPSKLARARQARVFLQGLRALPLLPSVVQDALNAGIWSESFQLEPTCPSFDCLWDPFTSLSLCSSCGPPDPLPELDCSFNPTDMIKHYFAENATVTAKSCTIRFRNGLVSRQLNVSLMMIPSGPYAGSQGIFGPEYEVFVVYTGLNQGSTEMIHDTIQSVKDPLLALTAVHFNLTNTSLVIDKAEECTLNFCLRDYSMKTSNKITQVNISNIRNGVVRRPASGNQMEYCWMAEDKTFSGGVHNLKNGITDASIKCLEDDIMNNCFSYWFDPDQFSFCMSDTYGLFLSWGGMIGEYLAGSVSQCQPIDCTLFFEASESHLHCEPDKDIYVLENSLDEPIHEINVTLKDNILHMRRFGLDKIMPNVAESMTLLNLQLNGSIIEGRAGSPVTYVHVRWVWLALPSTLLVAGAFLFLYTVIDARRHGIGIWKSSALAFLYHGLEVDELAEDDNVEKVSGMKARAARLRVRLVRGRKNGRTIMQTDKAVSVGPNSESHTLSLTRSQK